MSMDKEDKKLIRSLGFLSAVGMAMAISIGLGALIGYYLDKKLETTPWLFLVFFGSGIAAAVRNLQIMYKKSKKLFDD